MVGRGCRVECVQDADRVRLVGEVGDFFAGGPAQCVGLVPGGGCAVGGFASEDQRDDQARHVLVDAGEGRGKRDLDAGFFEDFALKRLGEGFLPLDDATRGFPVTVVATLDQQGSALVVDNDSGNAHGVRAVSGHVPRPSRMARLSTVATTLAHSSRYLKEYS